MFVNFIENQGCVHPLNTNRSPKKLIKIEILNGNNKKILKILNLFL